MGFDSIDNFIAEVSKNGKFWRYDWMKIFTGGTVVAGRWYDISMFGGYPIQHIHGNHVLNGDFVGNEKPWILGSANWAYTPATHLVTRTANADVSVLYQAVPCIPGISYTVIYTMTRSAGTLTPNLAGTALTARSAGGTYVQTVVCGSDANTRINFVPDASFAGTVDIVAITRDLDFDPKTQENEMAFYHGGNQSPDTKHLINMGVWGNASTLAPSVIMLVDVLGVYPRIKTDSNAVQTLTHGTRVRNGTFTGNADGWTLGSNWAYNSNAIRRTANASITTASQTVHCLAGVPYSVVYTIANYSAGTVTVSVGGATGTPRSANGTYTETLYPTTSDGTLAFTPNAACALDIDDVSMTPKIPRYEDGKGVRAFFSINEANGANAQNFLMTYTNQNGDQNRGLGAAVANTASAIVGHIGHSGVAAGNYGPFLPLMAGDYGIRSVESAQFSAASASAGSVSLILCRPIVSIPIVTGFVAAERDLMNQLPSLPQIKDRACLMPIIFCGAVMASGNQIQGYCDFGWS
jgi:hypothetical protein